MGQGLRAACPWLSDDQAAFYVGMQRADVLERALLFQRDPPGGSSLAPRSDTDFWRAVWSVTICWAKPKEVINASPA
jgi:hypothetical protein